MAPVFGGRCAGEGRGCQGDCLIRPEGIDPPGTTPTRSGGRGWDERKWSGQYVIGPTPISAISAMWYGRHRGQKPSDSEHPSEASQTP